MGIRTREWILAATVAALTTGCAANVAPSVAAGPPVTVRSSGSPMPSLPPSPSPNPSPTPSAAARVEACTAVDLDPRPIYESDGGMGSAFQTIVVRNVAHSACRLDSPVRLLYTDRHRAQHTVPTTNSKGG